ncbi:MAG: M28 family metallopeptidase, partial [Promethearchaeota archaeon]
MIDETRMKQNLEMLTFPRLSGTEGEKKAFNIVKEKIENLNLEPSVQEFSFTTFYPLIYQKIVFLLTFWTLFLLYLYIAFMFTIINLIVIFAIFIPVLIITRKPEKIRIGKKRESQNLFVKLLGSSENTINEYDNMEQDNERGNLLFLCHLDTKGQRLPMKFRVFFFELWIYSSICCVVIFILRIFIFIQYAFWFLIIGAIPLSLNFIVTIALCLNTNNNESPGAIDNASGVVCVLELLHYYSDFKFRLNNYNLWFLFTGAEENGTIGARHLYNKVKHLDKAKTFMLNFDTIGRSIDVITDERGEFFFRNTKDFTVTYHMPKRIRLSRSDAYIFADKGIGGFGVLDKQSFKYAHTKEDTIDKVDVNLLKKLLTHIT